MKILQSIRSVNPVGGGVIEVVKQYSRVMEQQGHDVTIASLDAPTDPWVRQCPFDVKALGPARGNYGHSPRFIPWFREQAAGCDAVIINGLWQFNSYGVWKAFQNTRQSYFVFPHGMLDPWFKRHYPLKHLKKWLYWPWAEYRVLRDATAVLFTCEQERVRARESFWLYRSREEVVAPGIAEPPGNAAAQREAFLERFPACRGKQLLLFLGRIHEKKGCDLLIRAFAEVAPFHDDLRLVLAGPEQQDTSKWRTLTGELQIEDRVLWTGMLSGDVKWGALRSADAFVLPSHQENFGVAVVEALACGVPVLISKEVNIWREIVDAGAGIAKDDTFEGTADLLQEWFELTADARVRMREQARDCFTARYEIGRATERLVEVLRPVTTEESMGESMRSMSAGSRLGVGGGV